MKHLKECLICVMTASLLLTGCDKYAVGQEKWHYEGAIPEPWEMYKDSYKLYELEDQKNTVQRALAKAEKNQERYIARADISRAKIIMSPSDYEYTGNAPKPNASVRMTVYTYNPETGLEDVTYKTLKEDIDYEIIPCSDNVNAGTVSVTISGKGAYHGTVTQTFMISPVPLDSATIPHNVMVYTGTPRTMSSETVVTARVNSEETVLTRDTDYTIRYSDNTAIGTASMTITGKGNFAGTLVKTFLIIPDFTTMRSAALSVFR